MWDKHYWPASLGGPKGRITKTLGNHRRSGSERADTINLIGKYNPWDASCSGTALLNSRDLLSFGYLKRIRFQAHSPSIQAVLMVIATSSSNKKYFNIES